MDADVNNTHSGKASDKGGYSAAHNSDLK